MPPSAAAPPWVLAEPGRIVLSGTPLAVVWEGRLKEFQLMQDGVCIGRYGMLEDARAAGERRADEMRELGLL